MDLLKIFSIILISSCLFTKDSSASHVSEADFKKEQVLNQGVNPASTKRLIYFWASWCPDCKQKLRGDLPAFKTEFPDVEIVTVNLDRSSDRGSEFIKEENMKLTVIRDDNKKFRKTFNIFSVPGWALLNKSGEQWNLIAGDSGSDSAKIRASIKKLQESK